MTITVSRVRTALQIGVALVGAGCLETNPPTEEGAGGLAVATGDAAEVASPSSPDLVDTAPACAVEVDCVGASCGCVQLECQEPSCSCSQRGGRCGPIVHNRWDPHYYWLYSDETECAEPEVCSFSPWPSCSGNVGEHVRVGPNRGYLELVRPARPKLGLLGCEGKEVFFAEGSCDGPRSQTVVLRTRRDRWGDTFPMWYDEPWTRSGSCPAACPQRGEWVACIDKNGDGDYGDPGEQSEPIRL